MTDQSLPRVRPTVEPGESVHLVGSEEEAARSPQWVEAQRRTQAYAEDDWERIRAEEEQVHRMLVDLFTQGVPPTDPRAMDAVDAQRAHVDRWFYPMTSELHRRLGEVGVVDPELAGVEDAPGLARWVSAAIDAACERRGPESPGEPH